MPDTNTNAQQLLKRFRELHRLSLADYAGFDQLYQDYLDTGCTLLNLKAGIVSQLEGNHYSILASTAKDERLAPGKTFTLSNTYCAWVVERASTVAFEQVSADPIRTEHPAYRAHNLEAYIATPIWVEGEIFGTLNFFDVEPRPLPFNAEDLELMELMALAIGKELEQDIAEQRRAATLRQLNETISLFESAFRYATIGLALVSPEGRWLRVNNALCHLLGYSADDLLALDFQTITHPNDLDSDLKYVKQMLAGTRASYQMEKRYIHNQGHIVWVMLSVSLVHNEDGSPKFFLSQIQDITTQKTAREEIELRQRQLEIANRRLEELAARDSLTQLLNRRIMTERLNEECARAVRAQSPLSLLIVDVDHFKKYNDEFGHLAGDKALKAVARELSVQARITDIVARYGGEEFVVILPNTSASASLIFAERVRLAIEQIGQLAKPITASIGCTTIDPTKVDPRKLQNEDILAAADRALYQAKQTGRNRTRHILVDAAPAS